MDGAEMNTTFAASAHELGKRRWTRVMHATALLAALLLCAPVAIVLISIAVRAGPSLTWDLLWTNPLDKGKVGGLWAPIAGTLALVSLSVMLVTPIGVAAAIYLNELAPPGRVRRLIVLAMTSLAGVPSIVHALFGLGAFVLFARMGASLLAAACTLAIMNLPVIVASSTQALAAVPMSFREACWNLGASRWQTIASIVLPNALAGILTGVIFAVSRAAGETAPILFTGAVFFQRMPATGVGRVIPYGFEDQFMALATHLHVIATQVSGMGHDRMYACALVLIVLVAAVNGAAIFVRMRLRTRRRW